MGWGLSSESTGARMGYVEVLLVATIVLSSVAYLMRSAWRFVTGRGHTGCTGCSGKSCKTSPQLVQINLLTPRGERRQDLRI